MRKALKRCVVLVITCVLLSGCSAAKTVTSEKVSAVGFDDLKITAAVFEDGMRDYMALHQNKLLFMEMGTHKFCYYVLDLETFECKKIKTIRNASYQSGNSVLVGDKLYFSVNAKEKYVMDFFTDTVKRASYVPKDAVLLTEYDGSLLVRRKDPSDNSTECIEAIDENGEAVPFVLNNNLKMQPICLSGYGETLSAIEKGENKYYFTRYDRDFKMTECVELAKLFSRYGITESIANFSVFGNSFYVSDFSNNALICMAEQGEVTVLMCENDIVPVKDFSDHASRVLFRRIGTNEMFTLETQTGEIRSLGLTFETPTDSVESAWVYNEHLLLVKENDSVE